MGPPFARTAAFFFDDQILANAIVGGAESTSSGAVI
jgi:hypothetical protein